MQLAEFTGNLREDLNRNPELLRACESVVNQLAKCHPSEWLHITFGMLSRLAELPEAIDAVPIAQYLSSSRAQLLKRCFMLIIEEEEFEIDDETAEEALRTHVLYHPHIGEPINDFEKALHVYFTVSERGKSVLGASK